MLESYLEQIQREFPHIRKHQEDDEALLQEALQLKQAGHTAEAEAKYKAVIVAQPEHQDGYEHLALMYQEMGRVAEARYFMQEALMRARRFLREGSLDPIFMHDLVQGYASMDVGAYQQMTAQQLVAAQVGSFQWPDPDLLRAIVRRGAEVVPHLRGVLREDPDGTWASNFAVQLIVSLYVNGVSEAAAAMPELVNLFRQDFEDWLEFVSRYLAGLGEVAVEPLLAVACEDGLAWYGRAMAFDAAMYAAAPSPELRARVAECLRTRLAGFIARNEADDEDPLVADLVGDLSELRDPLARELIHQAFAAKLVDESVLDEKWVDERYAGKHAWEPRTFNPDWIDDYEDELHEQEFKPEPEPKQGNEASGLAEMQALRDMIEQFKNQQRLKKPIPTREPAVALVRPKAALPAPTASAQPKPGRNDPCWCGSGKKYKHCHQRTD